MWDKHIYPVKDSLRLRCKIVVNLRGRFEAFLGQMDRSCEGRMVRPHEIELENLEIAPKFS
jgi:hypothetical protein